MGAKEALEHLSKWGCDKCQEALAVLRAVVDERDYWKRRVDEVKSECAHIHEVERDALKAEVERLREWHQNEYEDRMAMLERAEKAEALVEELRLQLKYPDPEDMPGELAAKFCPFKDPLHFHHDGCPSEWAVEQESKDVVTLRCDDCGSLNIGIVPSADMAKEEK